MIYALIWRIAVCIPACKWRLMRLIAGCSLWGPMYVAFFPGLLPLRFFNTYGRQELREKTWGILQSAAQLIS